MMDSENIQAIVAQFETIGIYQSFEQNQDGHINKTFVASFRLPDDSVKRYIVQIINTSIFTEPEKLIDNISKVTDYLRTKIKECGGDPARETLQLVPTKDAKLYYVDSQGRYWRMYHFIEGAKAYQSVERPVLFRNSARAFGRFQKLLANYPADTLAQTIPHFHDTPKRFEDFKKAVFLDKAGRRARVEKEISFALEHEKIAGKITEKIASGEVPIRVTHNDTKLNNIMIDLKTDEGICVIDLDTVMPGSALYDFGDSIRFGASSGSEDEKNLDSIFMRLDLFETYTDGYLSEAKNALNATEIDLLPMSAILMTLECGIRFLGDYLNGDVYFGIHYPEHNLDRTRTQFKLVADMELKYDQMMKIVRQYADQTM